MAELTIESTAKSTPEPTPAQPADNFIIGVRFMRVGKVYHFNAAGFGDVRPGDRVIVETTRGRQLGDVVNFVPPEKQSPPAGGYKAIESVATARDLALEQMWKAKETEAMIDCRERAHQLGLHDVKIVRAEYSYDGTRLTFLISGMDDGTGRLETRSLREDMQQKYPTQQVALRQIGPRDVAKLLGGMGACGLESRCCSSFLTEFSPVSIKMAKEQGLSLNPEEITGMQLGNRMVVFEINGSVDIDELARSIFFFALMILPWFQLARKFAQKSMLRAFRINVCPWGRDEDIHGAF